MFSNYGVGVKTMKRSAVLSKVKGDSEAQDFFNICFDSTDKAATMTLKVFKDLLDYPVIDMGDAELLSCEPDGDFLVEMVVPVTFRIESKLEQREFLYDVLEDENSAIGKAFDINMEATHNRYYSGLKRLLDKKFSGNLPVIPTYPLGFMSRGVVQGKDSVTLYFVFSNNFYGYDDRIDELCDRLIDMGFSLP